ncbi:MAG: hypothetical protein J2O48_03645 [Solirubrobacterales bacterium]|nr:hypothetical protein [Solirubrobacterales bacterium]
MSLLAAAAICLAVALSACGSKTGPGTGATARSLLKQTFSSSQALNSGVVSAAITLSPNGSSKQNKPLSISFGGPFQSRGKGKTPASKFTGAIKFGGQTGALTFLSTGTAGYVQMSGTSYKLPAATFKQMQSGFSELPGAGGSGSSGQFAKLGINPQNWVSDPQLVGSQEVGGAKTQHVHGAVAIDPLLRDLSKALSKAPNVTAGGTSVPKSISPATQAKIKQEVHNASLDLWTGSSDHTLRRLTVSADLPLKSAQVRQDLGGVSSLKLQLSLNYSDIGKPQTISAPSASKPYTQFQQKFSQIVQGIFASLAGGASGSSTGSSGSSPLGGSGSSGLGGGSSSGGSSALGGG